MLSGLRDVVRARHVHRDGPRPRASRPRAWGQIGPHAHVRRRQRKHTHKSRTTCWPASLSPACAIANTCRAARCPCPPSPWRRRDATKSTSPSGISSDSAMLKAELRKKSEHDPVEGRPGLVVQAPRADAPRCAPRRPRWRAARAPQERALLPQPATLLLGVGVGVDGGRLALARTAVALLVRLLLLVRRLLLVLAGRRLRVVSLSAPSTRRARLARWRVLDDFPQRAHAGIGHGGARLGVHVQLLHAALQLRQPLVQLHHAQQREDAHGRAAHQFARVVHRAALGRLALGPAARSLSSPPVPLPAASPTAQRRCMAMPVHSSAIITLDGGARSPRASRSRKRHSLRPADAWSVSDSGPSCPSFACSAPPARARRPARGSPRRGGHAPLPLPLPLLPLADMRQRRARATARRRR